MKTALRVFLVFLLACTGEQTSRAAESFAEKVKKFFSTPTPTPAKKRKRSTAKKSPTPTPTPTATPSPKRKKSTPTPEPSETPKPKSKKKKASPTPKATESPTPTATPEESPIPTSSAPPTETPTPTSSPAKKGTPNATISPNELADYEDYPPTVRKIVDSALELTKQNLNYVYGSADPANGGMDCSGFIYYVLRQNGITEVPRDSSQQYVWLRKAGNFHAVVSRKADSFELDELKPGDLLFWTGTYNIDRDPPITHTMIYLGREKETKKRIMVGSSDGRTYEDKQRFGVSVFDFKLSKPPPSADAKLSPVFVGYGRVPGLGQE